MSKESNAIRRWRQGRLGFAKLKSLVSRYRQEAKGGGSVQAVVEELPDLEVEEHEHGDNCTHH